MAWGEVRLEEPLPHMARCRVLLPLPHSETPPPTWGYSCCLGRGQPLPLTFGDPNKRKASGSDFKLEVKMESS